LQSDGGGFGRGLCSAPRLRASAVGSLQAATLAKQDGLKIDFEG
jgi:hypothetical protein